MDKNNLPTLEEDPKFWAKQGERKLVKVMGYMAQTHKCPFCNLKFDKPLKLREEKKDVNNPYEIFSMEVFFHIQSTHGYDPEVFMEMLVGEQ